jgi:hypothetical protein
LTVPAMVPTGDAVSNAAHTTNNAIANTVLVTLVFMNSLPEEV